MSDLTPDEHAVGWFRRQGFLVLRRAFDPVPLSDETDRVLAEQSQSAAARKAGSGGVEFRSAPMMCERTPESLALLDAVVPVAEALIGRRVLPVRAKGTRYYGSTDWHTDSELDLPSLGITAYLEPVTADTGALRVVPGSHRADVPDAPAEAIPTEPGDIIVFDEHLAHGSAGGADRRQWRIDFVPDPIGTDETATVHGYFARIFDPGWDGGYDAVRYPSYGTFWQQRDRPWTRRLRELGVYELADAQESAMRDRGTG